MDLNYLVGIFKINSSTRALVKTVTAILRIDNREVQALLQAFSNSNITTIKAKIMVLDPTAWIGMLVKCMRRSTLCIFSSNRCANDLKRLASKKRRYFRSV